MSRPDFVTDAQIETRITLHGGAGCRCPLHQRRLFTELLLGAGACAALPALAREGVDVGGNSPFTKLASAAQIEQSAQQQYLQLSHEASSKGALAGANHPQVIRLRAIARRIIPYTYEWNSRARDWKWEVNLIGAQELNAFCMPGGKIAFYQGILAQLQLSDDEVAMIMGHEMAHALREHARERIGKRKATNGFIAGLAAFFGWGELGRTLAGAGGDFLNLEFSRENESEADLVGMELAARAGYNPRAGITLWQKMMAASKGAPLQFLSTHPSSDNRIKDIEANLPKVEGLYSRAAKPDQRFGPPKAGA
ncbi:MAG: M48 family metallopeptidase [Leptothrix sp. (in: b-proteobacteria)]